MVGCTFLFLLFATPLVSVQGNSSPLAPIYDDFMKWRYNDNPEFADNIGVEGYTDKLEDYSIDAFPTRKAALEGFLTRLRATGRDGLEPADQVTYDVLEDVLQTWLDGYKWRFYGPMSPISFLGGIQTNFDSRAGQVKFTSIDQFMNFARRIKKYGEQIDQIIERMNVAIQNGTTLHNASVAKVPGLIDRILQYDGRPLQFPMYAPFNVTLDEFVERNTDVSKLKVATVRAMAMNNIELLINQSQKLKTYIVETYMPNTRKEFGVYNMPNGSDYYRACLKWQLSVDVDPDDIHEQGKREVDRVHEEMKKIVDRAGFSGTVQEYIKKIKEMPQFYFNNSDDALAYFRSVYSDRIVPSLGPYFKNVPQFPFEIKPMAYDGPIGIYKNGAPDLSRPGIFYANVVHPENNPTIGTVALLLHESDPGHHFQDSFALTASKIPLFRKVTDFSKYYAVPLHFPFYTAYSEGWALYAEDLGEELMIYDNDFERLGKYSSEIFRAARMVVDTGIHAKGWSKKQAVDYLLNYTMNDKGMLEREMDRYSTWPGQAVSYTFGKLKIMQMRRKAGNQLCDHFDMAEFHQVMLENGAMPLSVLDKLVDNWISDVKQKANVCTSNGTKLTSGLLLAFISIVLYFVQ